MSNLAKVAVVWSWDTEDFINMFLLVARQRQTRELVIFEISDRKDDSQLLFNWLVQCKKDNAILVGFNSLNYDYPLIHRWLQNPKISLKELKQVSDDLISIKQPKFNRVKQPVIRQYDLFAINHYDNHARSCNLKKLQINMDWFNVMDSDEDFAGVVKDHDSVIKYCINDVDSTDNFAEISLPEIRARQDIKALTGIDCINWSNSKIGEQLMIHECAKRLLSSSEEIFENRYRGQVRIPLVDIVFDWIEFETPLFQEILKDIKTKRISDEEELDYQFYYDSVPISVKEGGIHGSLKGRFISNEEYVYIEVDVSSMHPANIYHNQIYPRHIGDVFTNVVGELYNGRLEIKEKLQNKALDKATKDKLKFDSDIKKKQLVSIFGKFGDKYSGLYDPLCLYKVTINNQLFALRWLELLKKVPDSKVIYVNTDGIVMKIKRSNLPLYYSQCEVFCKETKFLVEYNEYDRLCLRDVNNYCAVTIDGKVKTKGEYIYEIGDDYHKSINFKVSRKSAVEYLLFDRSFTDAIKEEKDIFKFTGAVRFKKRRTRYSNEENDLSEDEVQEFDFNEVEAKTALSKGIHYDNQGNASEVPPNLRFIYSKSGGTLWKVYDKPNKKGQIKRSKMFGNKRIISCNLIEKDNDLISKIDYQQYIVYARKLVTDIADPQIKVNIKKTKTVSQSQLTLGL